MPLKRTPPPSVNASPSPSTFATPMQHSCSETNVSEIGLEAGLSAASSASNLSEISMASKLLLKKNPSAKRKRSETTDRSSDKMELSKSEFLNMWESLQHEQNVKFEMILSSLQELKVSMDFISNKYDEAIKRIEILEADKSKDKKYISELETTLEKMDRNTRSTSIELRNIPINSNETKKDLINIVKNAALFLKTPLQDTEIRNIFRINSKAAVKPIVVDFTTIPKCENFINSYKHYNKAHGGNRLNTNDINVEGTKTPVYISEYLTQKERKLLYLARDFSKTHGYKFCWTSSGRIYLRKMEGSPHIHIGTKEDLDKLLDK